MLTWEHWHTFMLFFGVPFWVLAGGAWMMRDVALWAQTPIAILTFSCIVASFGAGLKIGRPSP